LAGCRPGSKNGETGTLARKLTLEGKPLSAETQVVFMHPEKGYAAIANTDAAGQFEIKGWHDGNIKNGPELPTGKYRVMVQPPAAHTAEPTAEEMLANPRRQNPKPEFPDKYRQTHTSGLEFEVKAGRNDFPIDLKAG
jgi:hypothetical protein